MGNDLHIIRNYEEPFDEGPITKPVIMKRKLTREELLAGYASIHDLPQSSDPRFKSPDELLSRVAPKKTGEVVPEVKVPTAPAPIEIKPESKEPQKLQEPIVPLKSKEEKVHFAMPDLATLRTELEKERLEQTKIVLPEPEVQAPIVKQSIQIEKTGFSPLFATAEIKHETPAPAVPQEDLNHLHQEEIRQWKEYSAGVKAWQAQVMDVVNKLKAQLKAVKDRDEENKDLKDEVRRLREELQKVRQDHKINILGWMKNIGRPTPIKPH
jgi:hypothetical protein